MMTKPDSNNKMDYYYLVILLFSIVFVPYIPLSSSFNLSVEEPLLLYPLIRLLLRKEFKKDRFSLILLAFSAYIVFTIFLNGHIGQLNEYFEILKIIKFLLVYQFAVSVFRNQETEKRLMKTVDMLFVVSFAINLFHFFDFFNFTRSVLIYYDPNSIDIDFYGLNSKGHPAAKRIVGTFGNPNDNAVFFLFFLSFYIGRINFTLKRFFSFELFGFIGSGLLIFLTQSRTGIFAMLLLLLVYLIYNRAHLIKSFSSVALLSFFIVLLSLFNEMSTNYIQNTSVEITENNSVRGRLEIWKQLIGEWKEKPVFGYGPNKAYMYTHNIYPENEYIFFLWRFGIIGLLFFMAVIFFPVWNLKRDIFRYKFVLLVVLTVAVTALTNIPFSNMKFLIIIALVFGYSAKMKERSERKIYL